MSNKVNFFNFFYQKYVVGSLRVFVCKITQKSIEFDANFLKCQQWHQEQIIRSTSKSRNFQRMFAKDHCTRKQWRCWALVEVFAFRILLLKQVLTQEEEIHICFTHIYSNQLSSNSVLRGDNIIYTLKTPHPPTRHKLEQYTQKLMNIFNFWYHIGYLIWYDSSTEMY